MDGGEEDAKLTTVLYLSGASFNCILIIWIVFGVTYYYVKQPKCCRAEGLLGSQSIQWVVTATGL